MKNLDWLAAQAAQNVINETRNLDKNEVDGLITKTLGVLQENGVYACLLFLFSRGKKDEAIAEKACAQLLKLTTELGKSPPTNNRAENALKFLTDDICQDLDTLLLVKQLWEQTLIYARYGAKGRQD